MTITSWKQKKPTCIQLVSKTYFYLPNLTDLLLPDIRRKNWFRFGLKLLQFLKLTFLLLATSSSKFLATATFTALALLSGTGSGYNTFNLIISIKNKK
jgi:hypothetical protein